MSAETADLTVPVSGSVRTGADEDMAMPCFAVLATNGPFCRDSLTLIQAVLLTAFRRVEVALLQKDEAIETAGNKAADQGPDTARLLVCHVPTGAMVETLKARAIPTILAVEPPEDTVAVHAATPERFLPALRAANECFAALASVLPDPAQAWRFALLGTDALDESFSTCAAMLAHHLGLPHDADRAETALRHYLGRPAPRERAEHEWRRLSRLRRRLKRESAQAAAALDADQSRMVERILGPLHQILLGEPPRPVLWSPEVFFHGDDPGTPLPGRLPLVGVPRRIGYGPYLYLSEGVWSVQIACGFTRRGAGLPVRFEAHNAGPCGCVVVNAPRAGFYVARFDMTVERADEPIQIVIETLAGAIEGAMTLRLVVLTRAGTPPPRLALDHDGLIVLDPDQQRA